MKTLKLLVISCFLFVATVANAQFHFLSQECELSVAANSSVTNTAFINPIEDVSTNLYTSIPSQTTPFGFSQLTVQLDVDSVSANGTVLAQNQAYAYAMFSDAFILANAEDITITTSMTLSPYLVTPSADSGITMVLSDTAGNWYWYLPTNGNFVDDVIVPPGSYTFTMETYASSATYSALTFSATLQDNINAIPEPPTMILVLFGMGLFVVFKRLFNA